MLRGQIVVFENVLVFAISIVIFIFCFTIFMNLQDYYINVGVHDQLNKIQNIVATAVITVAENSDINASIDVKLPKTIAGEYYELRLWGATDTNPSGNLTIKLNEVEKSSEIFGLGCCGVTACPSGCFSFSGRALSQKGKVRVYKNGGQINIL